MKPLRKEIGVAISNILDESVYAQLKSPIHEFYGMQLRDLILNSKLEAGDEVDK
jgi:hypothetical protein